MSRQLLLTALPLYPPVDTTMWLSYCLFNKKATKIAFSNREMLNKGDLYSIICLCFGQHNTTSLKFTWVLEIITSTCFAMSTSIKYLNVALLRQKCYHHEYSSGETVLSFNKYYRHSQGVHVIIFNYWKRFHQKYFVKQ